MICQRPFGEARSEVDALRELRKCAGTQFDPRVIDAFVAEYAARRAAQLQAHQGAIEQARLAAGRDRAQR